MRRRLKVGETLDDDRDRLALTLPVRAKFRGGRAALIAVPNAQPPQAYLDVGLVKALARAYRFRRMLEDGEVASIDALAKRFNLDRGHVGLTLKLAFLSPALTRAIVHGEQPPSLRLSHLLNAELPLSWNDQNETIQRLTARV